MLAKARRELEKLRAAVTADSVFNYFVTAYHVKDYLLASSATSRASVEGLYDDADLKACGAICNQGKHLKVDRRAKPVSAELSGRSGMIGVGMIGAMMVGGVEEWDLTYGSVSLDPIKLAERVLAKLEAYFRTNALPTE